MYESQILRFITPFIIQLVDRYVKPTVKDPLATVDPYNQEQYLLIPEVTGSLQISNYAVLDSRAAKVQWSSGFEDDDSEKPKLELLKPHTEGSRVF